MITILALFIISLAAFIIIIKKKPVSNNNITTIDDPISFGYKCMWIAVRTNKLERIAEILNLKKRSQSNWKTGVTGAYNNKIFITPPIHEWTLVVGIDLSNLSQSGNNEMEGYKTILNKLSTEFGEAQLFATHRITEYHVWAKSVDGETVRFYAYNGEQGGNLLVEGLPLGIEQQWNLFNTFSEEANDEDYFSREDIITPDEEIVMKLAESWSINPTTLEELKDIKPGLGIIGELKH